MHVIMYVDVNVYMCSIMCVCTSMHIFIYLLVFLEQRLLEDIEYIGIYVHKTFVWIVFILLIAYYHIINESKMYVNALAGQCVLSLRFIFSSIHDVWIVYIY